MTSTSIFVNIACPKDTITGGIELLHQLNHLLNEYHYIHSRIWYNGPGNNNIPEVYRKYSNAYVLGIPKENEVLIFPEIWADKVLDPIYDGHLKIIFWESVDNYFNWISYKQRCYYNENNKLKFPKDIIHLAQSYYAVDFLKNKVEDIDPNNILYIGDYLNEKFYNIKTTYKRRYKQIVYNPLKGIEYTKKLMELLPKVKFIPIENMSIDEVITCLSKRMIYIDLGDHPGKDRLPREAAMCGCCVLTSLNGSAAFKEDVGILKKYKFNRNGNLKSMAKMIMSIFDDFDTHNKDFESYRKTIGWEYLKFQSDVDKLATTIRDRSV